MRCAALVVVAAVCAAVAGSPARRQAQQGDDVLVTVDTGTLRGVVASTLSGTLYNRFIGIPFAAPPLGDLRFRAPQPAASWSGIRDALTFGSQCAQSGVGSEDCLYLNVYVPLVNDNESLAVLINIHGGGFTIGTSTNREPDYFIDKGVAVVTFDYRLGSIGFLSLLNDDMPGNAGLKDQVFALQWVNRNIAAFGGDPAKVTIFGESAGGCSTSHMFLTPATRGLFRGAIIESGEANAVWGVELNPREKVYRLAASLGFDTQGADDAAVAEFLRAASHSDLTKDDDRALSYLEKRRISRIAFAPVLEPESDTAVLTEYPLTSLRAGRYNQVPVMTGATSADGRILVKSSGILVDEAYAADMRENFTSLVGSHIQVPTVEEQTQAALQVENFYYGSDGFSTDDPQAVYDMISDMYFIYPAEAIARMVANSSDQPVHLYYFDYDGWGSSEFGMGHAATAAYVFVSPGPDKDPNSNDAKVSQLLTTLWTNFAKYGEPAPAGNPVTWERFTTETANYLDMKLEFVTRQDLLKDRMDLWKQIQHQ